MEEQFILRVPPSVSERIDRLLSEEASTSDEIPLDLCFSVVPLNTWVLISNPVNGVFSFDVIIYRHTNLPSRVYRPAGVSPPSVWRVLESFLPEGEDREHPACSPFGPRSKSLVVVAGLDLIQDWQLKYAEGLKKAGQEVKLNSFASVSCYN